MEIKVANRAASIKPSPTLAVTTKGSRIKGGGAGYYRPERG